MMWNFRRGAFFVALSGACVSAFFVMPIAGTGSEAAVIGKESRERFADYARRYGLSRSAVQRRFGASGLLDCPGRLASAQVVADRRVIVTNAHNVLNPEGGFAWALNACIFQIPGHNGKPVDIRISAKNWHLGTRHPEQNRKRDWVVLSLEAPVPETVMPYRVDDPVRDPLPVGGPIIVVAASHDNWRGRSRREGSIEHCRLRSIRVRISGRNDLLGFDCDTGKGASGAALLRRDGRGFRLVGLGVGQRDRGPGAPYDGALHFNAAVPIHGAIYQAIETVRRKLGTPQSALPPPAVPPSAAPRPSRRPSAPFDGTR